MATTNEGQQRVMSRGRLRIIPMTLRDRVMNTVGSVRERCGNICSERTLRRWNERARAEGHYEPRERGAWIVEWGRGSGGFLITFQGCRLQCGKRALARKQTAST